MRTYRIIERGDEFRGIHAGAEVYDAIDGGLLVIVTYTTTIYTDDPRGNYVLAECEEAPRDVTSLTKAEFDALPQVLVAASGEVYCRNCYRRSMLSPEEGALGLCNRCANVEVSL